MIVSIGEIIKNAGLTIISESLPDNCMGEVRDSELVYNKDQTTLADMKIIMSCLFIMHKNDLRGVLDHRLYHNGKFLDNLLRDAIDLVLPKETFDGPVYWKQHKININTINLQRARWLYHDDESDENSH